MIYEMRIYHCAPGKLPDLLKRFEETTLAFWDTYGIRQVGFWTVAVGPSNHDLHYILAWDSMDHRQKIWNAFMADPDWTAKRKESEREGPIVTSITNMVLEPTRFSALR